MEKLIHKEVNKEEVEREAMHMRERERERKKEGDSKLNT